MSETTLSAAPRTILRPEDAVRAPRSYRLDERDRPRAVSEDNRLAKDLTNANPSPNYVPISTTSTTTMVPVTNKEELTLSMISIRSATDTDPEPISQEETIERARRAVEEGRRITQNALGGNEAVNEAVRPGLTIDLGHARIARLPEVVVDLIRDEVERLSLSHNQIWHIPYRFEECSHLRYLNVRSNHFREFPRAVYKLPLLEILDISRNKLKRVPEEIKQLTSLRVFSLMHNRVEELPYSISDMNKLQILKVAQNPLRTPLRDVIEQKEMEFAGTTYTDNEKEIAITAEIKRYLQDERREMAVLTPGGSESGGENSESAIDTPKPLKRVLSSRFPVIPSTGAVPESPAELTIKSPGNQARPPPIPNRSHFRIQSGQNGMLRRQVAPLNLNSERNRSNSEGVLQATAAPRTKRLPLFRQEKSDLDTVEEGPTNRLSHIRGHSYASALQMKLANSPAQSGSSSPESPNDSRSRRIAYVRRLSSLPEQKENKGSSNPLFEGIKGILYSLYQVHPQISALINVAKAGEQRRNSLDVIFTTTSSHIEQLNDELENAGTIYEDEFKSYNIEENVKAACIRCIKSYTALCLQLQQSIPKIILGSDPRYVRTAMLLLYGSITEIKNACSSLGVEVRLRTVLVKDSQTMQSNYGQTIRASKPAQERAPSRLGPRLRSDTTIQHPPLNIMLAQNSNVPPHPASAYPPSLNLTGSTINGVNYTGNSLSSASYTGTTLGNRSRSNSRVATLSSVSSSVASTPRSGDTFVVPPANQPYSRFNTLTGVSEAEEERLFEQIFLALTAAYDAALRSLPIARKQFTRSLEAAEEGRMPKEVRDIWSNLLYRCKVCQDMSEALRSRLVNMKVKDPISGRNQRDFWLLCKKFMQSFVDLVIDMRDAKSMQVLSMEAISVLRPVQKASRDAGRLIDASPWSFLADNQSNTPMPSLNQYAGNNMYQNGNSFPHPSQQLTVNGISPGSVPLPATPLSAALGPAAQATIPSTPASAYGDQFFAGNVFQRADSLLSMPQATGMPFYNRRS